MTSPKAGAGPCCRRRDRRAGSVTRFINPLLQPYVIMKGLSEGLIEPIALQRRPASTPVERVSARLGTKSGTSTDDGNAS